ncbi:fructosamine kinase family protein [Staphylococcus intermedius]|uniref:Fructosamine kinase family protein n=1 Tax=Staphylococcus intermedius NCTC 11048 TaxID=1141106 RepID=A0A380G3Z9_STAIN|nr:fructosamine kinase family protein [Staphylococcus intermedius]PCF63933.1 fructosamine kinase [Staphylococcus intermedius]PCF78648.1 fructosamine kinase [Staphylococcus intermedius]PCF79621.1 fructosamine kinase [Staphylococcus intermedius]PCF86643.1 fructosamine kinase [Staphylococcus intermedius]PCF89720.1 fructosamine kinase [Staphylococcus intermedius]
MNEKWYQTLPFEHIQSIEPVSGGDVNQAYRVDTTEGPYFLLVQPGRDASFYDAEVAGLEAFEAAGVTAPRVIAQGQVDQDAYLLLSYLDEGRGGSQEALGKLVAQLHQTHEPKGRFGFHLPYEGGDIQFDNSWTEDWKTLFLKQRITPLVHVIRQRQLWSDADDALFEQVYRLMEDTLAQHESAPSLLHGDLWAGNYMFLTDGRPALFDPAPLYGDREFDLGATKVFGGFSPAFYEAYDAAYPLADGATLRIRFYELYLLLVHLVKFGTMYLGSVRTTMEEIIDEAS